MMTVRRVVTAGVGKIISESSVKILGDYKDSSEFLTYHHGIGLHPYSISSDAGA